MRASGDEMLITTPLGQGVARIMRQGDAVVLNTAEGKEYRAADTESLTERVLGLPPADRGPGRAGCRASPRPRSRGRGWKVEYQRSATSRAPAPTRMRLTNAGVRCASPYISGTDAHGT